LSFPIHKKAEGKNKNRSGRWQDREKKRNSIPPIPIRFVKAKTENAADQNKKATTKQGLHAAKGRPDIFNAETQSGPGILN
jgi:hypothetical protein